MPPTTPGLATVKTHVINEINFGQSEAKFSSSISDSHICAGLTNYTRVTSQRVMRMNQSEDELENIFFRWTTNDPNLT